MIFSRIWDAKVIADVEGSCPTYVDEDNQDFKNRVEHPQWEHYVRAKKKLELFVHKIAVLLALTMYHLGKRGLGIGEACRSTP